MSPARILLGALTTTIALTVAPMHAPAPADAAGRQPVYPKTGTWSFGPGASFKVTRGAGRSSGTYFLSAFHGVSNVDGNGCSGNPDPITVQGKHRLTVFSRGGYRSAGVGKNTPSTSNGVTPIPVTVVVGGAPVGGLLSVIWSTDAKSIISAEVDYAVTGSPLVPYCTSYFENGSRR